MTRFYTPILAALVLILYYLTAGASAHGASQVETKIVRVQLTGYCPCEKCCGKWALQAPKTRKTAAGRSPFVADGVAGDPNVFPYGTRFFIEFQGIGERVMDDRLATWVIKKDIKEGRKHLDVRIVIKRPDGTVDLEASHERARAISNEMHDILVYLPKPKGDKS